MSRTHVSRLIYSRNTCSWPTSSHRPRLHIYTYHICVHQHSYCRCHELMHHDSFTAEIPVRDQFPRTTHRDQHPNRRPVFEFPACVTRKRVMSQSWMSHITQINESCPTKERVLSHVWMPHIAHERIISHTSMHYVTHMYESCMGWLALVGSLKLQASFAEYRLFHRALLQKRPIILRSLLFVATP